MIRTTINIMLGVLVTLIGVAQAGQVAPWAPANCKSLSPGSVTINKVMKIGLAPFDPVDGINLIEVSGMTSGNVPVSVRFKATKASCTNCSAVEMTRIESSNICQDNARIAMALNKPLQFFETSPGALCDISSGSNNLKIYEIRQATQVNNLLPPGNCAVGTLPGVQDIILNDDGPTTNQL